MTAGVVPVSVVIPTIGRPAQLRNALASLAACNLPAAEVIVVDQSEGDAVGRVVAGLPESRARLLPCPGRGIGRALNAGLRAAAHDVVFVTNDDCTVAPDWIAVGLGELGRLPGGIVSGSVHAVGDPDRVPSLKVDPEAHDYTGMIACDVLYGANMAVGRKALLEIGGFDERIEPSAEDNDLCYRWLRAGRPLRYAPDMRVWHHDWRSPEELARLYARYGRGQGMFYAKHLRAGDRAVLRLLARDAEWILRDTIGAIRHRTRPPAPAWGMAVGLPGGLLAGWKAFRP